MAIVITNPGHKPFLLLLSVPVQECQRGNKIIVISITGAKQGQKGEIYVVNGHPFTPNSSFAPLCSNLNDILIVNAIASKSYCWQFRPKGGNKSGPKNDFLSRGAAATFDCNSGSTKAA